MVSKGFPNVTTSGRQYNFGEKPSVILYTYINLHAGTPKPQSFLSKSPGLKCRIQCYKVAIRYIEYIAYWYTVLGEVMQIVKRGTKGKRGFLRRNEEDDQPAR